MSNSEKKIRGLYCSISGAIPEEPVVSIKSGHLYEKRLIEQALATSGGKCPETNQDLSMSDLIPVQPNGTVVEPIMTEGASVPNVLQFLQTEWDKTSLEVHEVKIKLNESRKELASALYKSDAAEKIIARLTVENEQLKKELQEKTVEVQRVAEERRAAETQEDTKAEPTSNGDMYGPLVLSDDIFQRAKNKTEELQTKRKSRALPDSHASSAAVGGFGETGMAKLDGIGVVCCMLRRGKNVFAGTTSGKVVGLDADNMKFGNAVSAHDREVCRLKWCEDRLVSVAADGLVRFWKDENGGTPAQNIQKTGEWECGFMDLADVDVHPLGDLLFITGANGRWLWSDTSGRAVLQGAADGKLWSGVSHPDGMVFGTGGLGGVQMWDLRTAKCVARLELEREIVRDLAMSEKGYYMASCAGDTVKLWDLRKQSISGEVKVENARGVGFDDMGEYGCAVGGQEAAVFMGKKKAKVLTRLSGSFLDDKSTQWRLGCLWGGSAEYLLVGGEAGSIRKFSQQMQ